MANQLSAGLRTSMVEIDEAIRLASKMYDISGEEFNANFKTDILEQCGRSLANRHVKKDALLSEYLLFLKKYRQAYIQCLRDERFDWETIQTFSFFIGACFDQIELAATDEWMKSLQNLNDTAEKRMNLNSPNSDRKYSHLYHQHFSPLFLVNSNQKIVSLNQAALSIFPDLKSGNEFANLNFTSEKAKSDFLSNIVIGFTLKCLKVQP